MNWKPPRIFLSHSKRDQASAWRLRRILDAHGINVWIDEEQILVGESITGCIQRGLKGCDFMVLLLSHASIDSGWVEKEWQSLVGIEATKHEVVILPAKLDDSPLPPLLEDKKYTDLSRDFEEGAEQLASAILEHSRIKQDGASAAHRVAHEIRPYTHNRQGLRPSSPIVTLRSDSVLELSDEEVGIRLRELGMFDRSLNPDGCCVPHFYEAVSQGGSTLVADYATGLTWQQSGSAHEMTFESTPAFVRKLNLMNHGGYSDWRLPTLEEGCSLVERYRNTEGLFIDPIFDFTQNWFFCVDTLYTLIGRHRMYWAVFLFDGGCGVRFDMRSYVRAVRVGLPTSAEEANRTSAEGSPNPGVQADC